MTAAQVDALRTKEQTLSEALAGGGSLIARRLAAKTSWRFQYKNGGKLRRYSFGTYSPRGDNAGSIEAIEFTLVGARRRAGKLAALQSEVGDLVEHYSEKRAQAADERRTTAAARTVHEQHTRDYSLSKLCESYWTHLQQQGKPSAKDVRNSLTRWVIEKHASLASRKASDITTDDALTILRTIIADGKEVTMNRVRSYLSSAYTHGMGSSTDPLISSKVGGFRLTSNPVLTIKPVAKFEKAGNRVLSNNELAELLRRLDALSSPASKAVTLSLRLGGQRITQLLAATDYSADRQTLTLRDIKGRRTHARAHVLPVVSHAEPLLLEALANPHPRRPGLYGGLTMQTVSNEIKNVSNTMTDSEPFGWRDLRRTCETMLASMGISRDLRAQIQSHGLSGIQERHYDKHSYIVEKRAALEKWNRRLDELMAGSEGTANVVRIDRATG